MRGMGRYGFIVRRLIHLIPLLLGIVLLVFLLQKVTPGDPGRLILGFHASEGQVRHLDRTLGLDKSIVVQFVDYVGHVVTGNLGQSIRQNVPVATLIGSKLPITLLLVGIGSLLSLMISVPLGVLAARRPDGPTDHIVRLISTIGLTMPPFWVGILLIVGIALPTGLFPVAGYGVGFAQHLRSLVLPAIVLAIAIAPVQIRSLRAGLVDVRQSDYIAMARSVGVRSVRISWRHELPNAILPVITILTVAVGYSLFGAVVVEQIFGLPGLGQGMLNAVSQDDFPVVQGITLVFALIVVAVQLLSDVLYTLIDPRVEIR
jgi:peptide/nickel transport system permease protein